jgi:dolichol-phosphate mannosyltransferase
MNSTSLLIIPTYNEAKAIKGILESLNRVELDLDVLFVDDSPNPDTIAEIESIKGKSIHKVLSIHREHPSDGIAGAYQIAYKYAVENGYNFCFQMDADGQHRPTDLLAIYNLLIENGGMIIGSRYVQNGQIRGWSTYRLVVSKLANTFFRILFNSSVMDCTGGYRGFDTISLKRIWATPPDSKRFSVHAECTLRALRENIKILETPILFDARSTGTSKMSIRSGIESLKLFIQWKLF